jgi:hypothetical protein
MVAQNQIDLKIPLPDDPAFLRVLEANFTLIRNALESGVSGTFTTVDGKTITVVNGIVTSIV